VDEQQAGGAGGQGEPGEPGEPGERESASRRPANPLMRRLAAGVCAVEALVLLGFCGLYLWELAQGGSDDAGRAVVSTLLIAAFAVALGLLARAWVRGAGWPNTPTVVWNLLLLPVSWSLLTGGQAAIGAAVALAAVVGVVAAALAGQPPNSTG
jgi:hypothetical protein